MRKSKASDIAIMAIMIALIIIIQVVSAFIYPLLPLPLSPTLASIPVIIGSIFLGAKKGAVLGFFMGLVLFIQATITPGVFNGLFTPFIPLPGHTQGTPWALVVSFVPRILIGIFPYFVAKFINNRFGFGLAGVVGTVTNTIFVFLFIFLFFGWGTLGAIIGITVLLNSLIEAVAAAILTAAIVPALAKSRGK